MAETNLRPLEVGDYVSLISSTRGGMIGVIKRIEGRQYYVKFPLWAAPFPYENFAIVRVRPATPAEVEAHLKGRAEDV